MKIYVKFNRPRTVREFIALFFSGPVGMYGGRSVPTFLDKECTEQQCEAGRARSIQDLCSCVKTYFPSVTQKKVLSELLTFKLPGKYFRPYHCGTIKRPVMSFNIMPMPFLYSTPVWVEDSFGWKEALSKLGITTIDEMYEYQK